ncbi:MAG TPA: PIN domain-containing protein [Thermoanaerobaculia bacterium]|nr:PIN domain-containing protein [Thermoanaerobaculia bacterium]
MTHTCFVDSWYFIAALDPFDSHHAAALRLDAKFIRRRRVVTHDGVLSEVLTHFSDEGSRARQLVASAVRQVIADHIVIPGTRELFERALDLYERRSDKAYSLVDCMSMVVMRDRGIEHVLTNDHHFRQEGFTVLADAP